MPLAPAALLPGLALALLLAAPVRAQQAAPPRFGAGFDVSAALPGQSLLPPGVAVGARVRAALPVNADLSVAADVGLSAHLFEGSADARYVLNPQTSVIVTLPGRDAVRYVIGGFGGFIPLEGGGGGPSLHLGVGTAIPLRDTSLYLEFDPSLLIGESETTGVLAGRVGVIF
ncbi:MAG TPA: hypothetical protein VF576_03815 [Rubricoccaceae bacterium]|jgi:hypothetical protein